MNKKRNGTGASFWLQLQKENRIKKFEKYSSILEITGALSLLVILLNIGNITITVIFSVLIGICIILYPLVVYKLWDLKGWKRII